MSPSEICSRCNQRERPCSGACACLVDPQKRDIRELIQLGSCPVGKFKKTIAERIAEFFTAAPEVQPSIQREGPALWAELHRWALYGDIDRPILWLGKFTDRLGALGCNCANEWKAWMLANPPNVESREALFRWTVDAHNAVNARLNKPQMTLEEAMERWK